MKKVYRTLFLFHLVVGIGAMGGGLVAILDPYSPMGIPVDALKNSPFRSFLIPGIVLFGFIGLGNIFGALMLHFQSKYRGYISGVLGAGLALWIVIQCVMLWAVAALHVIFFAVGLIQGALSLLILYDDESFPFNILRKYLRDKH